MRLFALLIFSLIVSGASLNDARKANEAFRNGDYERAVELYQQAIDQNPDDARLHFNLGNALSELDRGEEALEAYSRYQSLTENREQQSLADYNAGRTLINNEQYEEAAEYFREALKKNPGDADARYNYELAVKQKQEHEEQQQNPESGDDENEQDQDQQNDQDQDNNQDQNEQNQQEGNNDSNDSESEQQPQDSENQDGEQDQQTSPQNISQEEAESILEALEQLERDLLENQKKVAKESNQKNDKDW